MPTMRTTNTRPQAPHPEAELEARLDALVCGDCTEREFVDEALERYNSKSSVYLISRIDHYYQRGQLPDPVYRSIKAMITQRVLARAIEQVDESDHGALPEIIPATVAGRTYVAEPPTLHDEVAPRASAPEPPALPYGHMVRHRYSVLAHLGRGAIADVYKVTDESRAWAAEPERRVALKLLREPADKSPEARDALRREFDALRRLAHPSIVKVHDFDQDETTTGYSMELLEGERLSDLIARRAGKPLPRAYVLGLVRAVGGALAHAHSRGIIHGDVCARNVLIGPAGELRVLGFGAESVRSALATYASCEVLQGEPPEARDDVFALACLAWELLGGRHPFEGASAAEMRARGAQPSRPSGLDVFTWRTLKRALAWAREDRPESMRQWLAALGMEPEPSELPPIDQESPRNLPMRVQHVAFVAALIASAALAYFFVWHSIDPAPEHAAPAVADAASAPPAATPDAKPGPTDTVASAAAAAAAAVGEDAQEAPAPAAAAKPAVKAPPAKPTLRFEAKRFAVAPGRGFAEIHVSRSRPVPELDNFMWWTEDSSAHSGVDFVAQDRTTHPFGHGARTATIYVKILPRTDRAHAASFKVCAGAPSGNAANDVTCSAVVIPARG